MQTHLAEMSEAVDPKQSHQAQKRLSIDLPDWLHRQIKMSCARDGLKITDLVRDLLLQHFKNEEGSK